MSQLTPGTDPLLRFASRVVDHLQDAQPRTLRLLISDVLAGLGRRLSCGHIHLFSIRQRDRKPSTTRLLHAWAENGIELPKNSLRNVPVALFSSPVVELLISGHPAFVSLIPGRNGCSRLITGLMHETGTTGYLLCPIHLKRRLCGVIGIAHSFGSEHVSKEACQHLRLIGKLVLQAAKSVRRDAKRRRDHRQWKKIADASCDFGFCISENGEILRVIPFGCSDPPDTKGVRLEGFFDKVHVGSLRQVVQQCLERNEPSTCEARGMGIEGGMRWYHVRVEPQMTSGTRQVAMFLSDIDERRIQSDELQKLQDQLHRASRLSLLGQISTEFAHQINQPLQAIMNYSETMRTREENRRGNFEKRMTSISRILASVEQAAMIVRRIREFAQRRSLTLRPADLCSVMQRAVIIAGPRAEECGVQLLCRTSEGDICTTDTGDTEKYAALIDDVQTTHVVINLIVNAVEACSQAKVTRPRVEVSLSLHSDPLFLQVQVSDNGPGLPKANPNFVFEKFRTTKPEGLGMGLAISKNVIEAQYGQLWATNNPDQGCTFFFTVRRCTPNSTDTDVIDTVQQDVIPAD